MRRRFVSRDPYWTQARYPSECRRCKREIRRGERIYYYPNGRAVYCADDACGGSCHREFSAAALAEDCGGLR